MNQKTATYSMHWNVKFTKLGTNKKTPLQFCHLALELP